MVQIEQIIFINLFKIKEGEQNIRYIYLVEKARYLK